MFKILIVKYQQIIKSEQLYFQNKIKKKIGTYFSFRMLWVKDKSSQVN